MERWDHWSLERLTLEASLSPQLGGTSPTEATPESAAQTAAATHGEARVYYALAKSPFGAMGGLPSGGRVRRMVKGRGGQMPSGDIGATIVAEQRQRRLRELGSSPEEQVENARQHAAAKIQMKNFQITQ